MAGLLSGYSSIIGDAVAKKNYSEELEMVNGIDTNCERQLAR